jgi:precorrin-2 dehydrogenase
MSYCPVFLNITGRRCVVVGGGAVAWRKVNMLLEHGAQVEVISPQMCLGLGELAASCAVKLTHREYKSGDLKGAFIVVAATNDSQTNERVAEEAKEQGTLINVVDVPKLSNFIVPSSLRRGDLTVAVSTSGKSPALARKIVSELAEDLGEEYSILTSLVSEVRSELKQRGINISGEAWQQALELDSLLDHLRLGQRDEAKKRLLGALVKG